MSLTQALYYIIFNVSGARPRNDPATGQSARSGQDSVVAFQKNHYFGHNYNFNKTTIVKKGRFIKYQYAGIIRRRRVKQRPA